MQLYALAVVTVLSTAKYFYAYLAFGWGFSWISVVFWVVLKYKYENRGCWDINYRHVHQSKAKTETFQKKGPAGKSDRSSDFSRNHIEWNYFHNSHLGHCSQAAGRLSTYKGTE